MEVTLQQKQQFLRDSVLQSDLNVENFMIFMGTIKNEGEQIDINNWTIAELKTAVQKFKELVSSKQLQSKKSQEDTANTMGKELAKSIIRQPKQKKIFYLQNNVDFWDYEFKAEQQCKQIQKRIDMTQNPKINFVMYQAKKSGGFIFGFGANDELWITISTTFTKQKVSRKNQDFEWLQRNLVNVRFGCYVPPLQEMRAFQPEDKSMQLARSKTIIKFMNNLLNYDYIAQSQILWNFLTLNTNDFNTLKNNLQNNNRPDLAIKNIKTTTGTFTPQLSARSINFIRGSSSFSSQSVQVYQLLGKNICKMLGDLQNLSKHALYVANDFATLHEMFNKLNTKNDSVNESQMSTILIYLNNLVNSFSKSTKSHLQLAKSIKDQFINPLKQQWEQFSKFEKRRNHQLNEYIEKKKNSQQKKITIPQLTIKMQYEELKKNGQLNKMSKAQAYSKMFPKDNEEEDQMRMLQGYLNCMYQTSFNLFINAQQKKYIRYMDEYIERLQKLNSEEVSCLQGYREIIKSVVVTS